MLSWETGVQFGQALADIKAHSREIATLNSDVAEIKAEIITIKAVVYRGALVLALWGGGIMLNLPADRVGELAATFLKGFAK